MNSKQAREMTIQQSRDINISGWLSYKITQVGPCPCRVNTSERLEAPGDSFCVASDGIPFSNESKLRINFDNTEAEKEVYISYTELICC